MHHAPRDPPAVEPATILLHKPVGFDAIEGRNPARPLIKAATRWPDDPTGIELLDQHFIRLTPLVPLDADASGLMVFTQDGRAFASSTSTSWKSPARLHRGVWPGSTTA